MRSYRLLGAAHVVERVTETHGQVRDDDIELALKWRVTGERLEDQFREVPERARIPRAEPEHLRSEPVRVIKLEVKGSGLSEQALRGAPARRRPACWPA